MFPYYPLPKHSKKKRERLENQGIHDLTGSQGRILLDSGGFQLYRKSLSLDYKDTLGIYKAAQLRTNDHAIALDFVPFPSDPPDVRIQKIHQTIDTYRAMKTLDDHVIPVIHGITKKEFELSFTQIDTPTQFISFPSNFPMITMKQKGVNDESLKDMIMARFITFLKLLKEKRLDEARIHILGATGQNSSHLCWFAGMDQTDSSSWRLKAAYGKIALPEVAEAKISAVKSTFGVREWKPEWDAVLKECGCPICKHLDVKQRKVELAKGKTEGFNNRCIHNAFVYLQERNLAREMIGHTQYQYYLEKRFKGTWWARFLSKVQETRHQKGLDLFLRGEVNGIPAK